jgi:FixJ family two-component response regulator
MTSDGYVHKVRQNSNNAANFDIMQRRTGKERGTIRSVMSDYYNRELALETGMSIKKAKNFRKNWDSK